jgi:molecular chaperone DnaK (HSP70)
VDVSEHVLLGGDNIDAAVAEHLGALLREKQGNDLSFSQRLALRVIARDLKERVLSDSSNGEETVTVSVPGGGSSLFSSSISLEISADDLRRKVLDGFFPLCSGALSPVAQMPGGRYIRE